LSSVTGPAPRSMGTRQLPPIDVVGCPLGGAIRLWGQAEKRSWPSGSPLGRTQSGDHSRTTSVTSTPAFASPRMIIRIERSTVRIPYSGERSANAKTSDAEAPVRSPFWGTLATDSALQQSSLRSEPTIGMIIFRMRLIRILPLMASWSPAFAKVGDVYIPQCDREHERCISRSFTASTAQCRKSRAACRTATINEAIRNSGMSASELFDMRSPRRTEKQGASHR